MGGSIVRVKRESFRERLTRLYGEEKAKIILAEYRKRAMRPRPRPRAVSDVEITPEMEDLRDEAIASGKYLLPPIEPPIESST